MDYYCVLFVGYGVDASLGNVGKEHGRKLEKLMLRKLRIMRPPVEVISGVTLLFILECSRTYELWTLLILCMLNSTDRLFRFSEAIEFSSSCLLHQNCVLS
jgi:hypothetical protein